MIFGVLIRFVLEFCRRRGMKVPDITRLRRRPLTVDVTGQAATRAADLADEALRRRAARRDQRRQATDRLP